MGTASAIEWALKLGKRGNTALRCEDRGDDCESNCGLCPLRTQILGSRQHSRAIIATTLMPMSPGGPPPMGPPAPPAPGSSNLL